ncbi:MAG: OadG family protein [Pirellulaceae bacterium]|nr:OadG family protein [Pirellulaceae bacterium]
MPLDPALLANLPAPITWAPLWEDTGLPLAVMGIAVVFVALTLVSLFIALLPRLIELLDRLHPVAEERGELAAGSSSAAEVAAAAEGDVPEEIVVVITAAVAEMMGRPHRVVHIRGLTAEELGWSLEGRMQLHTSHQVHRRDRP